MAELAVDRCHFTKTSGRTLAALVAPLTIRSTFMQIAYATTYDAHDVHNWSGLGTYIARALESTGLDLDYVNVGPVPFAARVAGRLVSKAARRRLLPEREPYFAKRRSSALSRELRPHAEIVFSPGTLPIAYLGESIPHAFWTDATFASIVDFYPEATGLHPRTLRNGNELEQRALETSAAAIYASDWAAASAIKDYGTDPAKVHVLPFGANLVTLPEPTELDRLLSLRSGQVCRLLFVGLDWARKGGSIAVETARLLNLAGVETELTVIGANVPGPIEPFVKSLGFVNKKANPEMFTAAYERSHFLLVPSRAESAGVVYAEASAFGVPSIATDVGGVSTQIKDGVSGRLFPLEAGPEEYAEFIASALSRYEEAARRTFVDYRERLDWSVTGRRVRAILEECLRS